MLNGTRPARGPAWRTSLIATATFAVALAAHAGGDAQSGRQKAINCLGCHGPDGISVNDIWPNLAGQNAGYLEKSLRDYRGGERSDPIMQTFARHLSDADISDLAAYYAGLPRRPGHD